MRTSAEYKEVKRRNEGILGQYKFAQSRRTQTTVEFNKAEHLWDDVSRISHQIVQECEKEEGVSADDIMRAEGQLRGWSYLMHREVVEVLDAMKTQGYLFSSNDDARFFKSPVPLPTDTMFQDWRIKPVLLKRLIKKSQNELWQISQCGRNSLRRMNLQRDHFTLNLMKPA